MVPVYLLEPSPQPVTYRSTPTVAAYCHPHMAVCTLFHDRQIANNKVGVFHAGGNFAHQPPVTIPPSQAFIPGQMLSGHISNRQTTAPSPSPTLQHRSSTGIKHSSAEAVLVLSFSPARLICSLHPGTPLFALRPLDSLSYEFTGRPVKLKACLFIVPILLISRVCALLNFFSFFCGKPLDCSALDVVASELIMVC